MAVIALPLVRSGDRTHVAVTASPRSEGTHAATAICGTRVNGELTVGIWGISCPDCRRAVTS